MSKGIEVLEDTVLAKFLGSEGIEELRSKIIDMIVEEIREQLQDSPNYIISPNDICTELFDRAIEDIASQVTEEYKEKINEAVAKKLAMLGV